MAAHGRCRERWQHTASLLAQVHALFHDPAPPWQFMPPQYRPEAQAEESADEGRVLFEGKEGIEVLATLLRARKA